MGKFFRNSFFIPSHIFIETNIICIYLQVSGLMFSYKAINETNKNIEILFIGGYIIETECEEPKREFLMGLYYFFKLFPVIFPGRFEFIRCGNK